jgi:hypothetical protein
MARKNCKNGEKRGRRKESGGGYGQRESVKKKARGERGN